MKKALAFISAIMVLTFSMIPCADNDCFPEEQDRKYEAGKSAPLHNDHSDACSPFCICACCAGFSITFTSTPFSVATIPFKKIHFSFIEAKTYSIALPIWQPPQLV